MAAAVLTHPAQREKQRGERPSRAATAGSRLPPTSGTHLRLGARPVPEQRPGPHAAAAPTRARSRGRAPRGGSASGPTNSPSRRWAGLRTSSTPRGAVARLPAHQLPVSRGAGLRGARGGAKAGARGGAYARVSYLASGRGGFLRTPRRPREVVWALTWLKLRLARHVGGLPSLAGGVCVGLLSFASRCCCSRSR